MGFVLAAVVVGLSAARFGLRSERTRSCHVPGRYWTGTRRAAQHRPLRPVAQGVTPHATMTRLRGELCDALNRPDSTGELYQCTASRRPPHGRLQSTYVTILSRAALARRAGSDGHGSHAGSASPRNAVLQASTGRMADALSLTRAASPSAATRTPRDSGTHKARKDTPALRRRSPATIRMLKP